METAVPSPTSELKPMSTSQHEIVHAGAGAGKTTELTVTVERLFDEHFARQKKLPRFVVCTFTRKATQELRERLLRRALKKGDPDFLRFTAAQGCLFISTIHGVLHRFLRESGADFDLPEQIELLNEPEARVQAKILALEVLKKNLSAEEMTALQSYQEWHLRLREFYEQWLLAPDIQPHSKLHLLDHLSSRLTRAIQGFQREWLHLNTESLPAKYLEHFREISLNLGRLPMTGYKKDCADSGPNLSATEIFAALNELAVFMDRWPRKPNKPKGICENLEEQLKDLHTRTKAELQALCWNPDYDIWLERIAVFQKVALEFSQDWLRWKRENCKFEMVDLENLTLRWVREKPESATAFADRWHCWLIDEYQDTSPTQVELLEYLMGSSKYFLVGDPQQSIYLFRGARSDIFLGKINAAQRDNAALMENHEFESPPPQPPDGLEARPKVAVRSLSLNYRSRPELLMFMNDFFSAMSVSQQFQRMRAKGPCSEPQTIVAQFVWISNAVDDTATGVVAAKAVEAEIVVKRIQLLLDEGVAASKICVLCRKLSQIQEVQSALRAAKVPHRLSLARGFFRKPEIQDALSLCRCLLEPDDSEALLQVLRSPYFKVSDKELVKYRELLHTADKSELHEFESQVSPELQLQLNCLKSWREKLRTEPFSQVLATALKSSRVFSMSKAMDPTGQREANLWRFLTDLEMNESEPAFEIHHWLNLWEKFSAVGSEEDSESVSLSNAPMVQVMSVHASKGLQFDHVLIPYCGESLRGRNDSPMVVHKKYLSYGFRLRLRETEERLALPMDREQEQAELMRVQEENERLLYVATTRAKESVHFFSKTDPAKGSWAEHFPEMARNPGFLQTSHYAVKVITQENSAAEPAGADSQNTQKNALDQIPGVDTDKPLRRPYRHLDEVMQGSQRTASQLLPSGIFGLNVLAAQARGQLWHFTFESLSGWLKTGRAFEDFAKNLPDDLQAANQYLYHLTRPPMKELLRYGNCEWGFCLQAGQQRFVGQIDLWGIENDQTLGAKLWVIDYKTGPDRDFTKAMQQLTLYALALKEFGYPPKALAANRVYLAAIYPQVQRAHLCSLDIESTNLREVLENQKWPNLENL